MAQDIAHEEVKKAVYPFFFPLGRLLSHFNVQPVTFTIGGLIASFFSFLFLVSGSLFWASIMILVTELNDIVDGLLARYAKKESRFGAFIDSTIDRYAEGFIYLGLLVFFWEKSLIISLFILLAFIGSILVSYTRARAEGVGFFCRFGLMKRKIRMAVLFISILVASFISQGEIVLGSTIITLAILCHFTALQRILYVRKQSI
ncbi:CDP-alcohol phosphatidyltransferase family protein [Patescibacteria group bacterium]